MTDLTSAERKKFAALIREHVALAVRLHPDDGRISFVFGSLCSAVGIEEDEFSELLDAALGDPNREDPND